MNIITSLNQAIGFVFGLLNSFYFILSLFLLIISCHIILFFIKDMPYFKVLRDNDDPETIFIEDLKNKPLLNIIIPAWKEGKVFENLLQSINKLKYPNINVIVNAGGDEKTIKIANKFGEFENFVILRQKSGGYKASLGKIRAINDCLEYVEQGVVLLVDADCDVDDELILRMIHPITNLNEGIVNSAGQRPLNHQKDIDFLKFKLIQQLGFFKKKFGRYDHKIIAGACCCLTYDVLQSIGKFSEVSSIATEIPMGNDILSKGYKIYQLSHYNSCIYTEIPLNIKQLAIQKQKDMEDSLNLALQNKDIFYFIKLLVLSFISFYLLSFPLLSFISPFFFYMGCFLLLHLYQLYLRKVFFFKKYTRHHKNFTFGFIFYIKLVFYVYINMLIASLTLLKLIMYKKRNYTGN